VDAFWDRVYIVSFITNERVELLYQQCQLAPYGISVILPPSRELCDRRECKTTIYTHTRLTALFRDYPGKPVPERKTNLDFTQARDSEWQWHQLGHMQVCTSLQSDNHASTPPLSFFTGRVPFLPPNQQRQSTEGTKLLSVVPG